LNCTKRDGETCMPRRFCDPRSDRGHRSAEHAVYHAYGRPTAVMCRRRRWTGKSRPSVSFSSVSLCDSMLRLMIVTMFLRKICPAASLRSVRSMPGRRKPGGAASTRTERRFGRHERAPADAGRQCGTKESRGTTIGGVVEQRRLMARGVDFLRCVHAHQAAPKPVTPDQKVPGRQSGSSRKRVEG